MTYKKTTTLWLTGAAVGLISILCPSTASAGTFQLPYESAYYEIESAFDSDPAIAYQPNKCVDVQWGRLFPARGTGTPVWLYDCNQSPAQLWRLRPVQGYDSSDGWVSLQNAGGRCLDVPGANVKQNWLQLQIYECNNTKAQIWNVDGTLGGGLDGVFDAIAVGGIFQRNNTYCLDIRGGQYVEKTPIQLYQCNETLAQGWRLNLVKTSISHVAASSNLGTYDTENNLSINSPTSTSASVPEPSSIGGLTMLGLAILWKRKCSLKS